MRRFVEEAEWAIDAVAECLDDFVGESSSVRVAVNEFWWVTLYDLRVCPSVRSLHARDCKLAKTGPDKETNWLPIRPSHSLVVSACTPLSDLNHALTNGREPCSVCQLEFAGQVFTAPGLHGPRFMPPDPAGAVLLKEHVTATEQQIKDYALLLWGKAAAFCIYRPTSV